MRSGPPNAVFAHNLLLFGRPERGGVAAQGFVLQPPDLRGAGAQHLNAFQDKVRTFLALLAPGLRAQFQFGADGDYRTELTDYYRETEAIATPAIRTTRLQTFHYLWDKMQRRALRRERCVLFLSSDIAPEGWRGLTREALARFYEKLLVQLRTQFDELADSLRAIFGPDTMVTPMDDTAHFAFIAKFLNPSLAERFDLDLAKQFNPALSLQENCWNGDGVGLNKIGFYLDGRYHTLFTLKRWPSHTTPGIIYRLTGLDFLDYQITANLEPLPTRREVDKEEKAIERLRGEYRDTERHSLLVAIGKKERKVESLSSGVIRPFAVTYVIRVWDETEAGLAAKCGAIKNAVNGLGGAQYYECARPSTAKKVFFATWPGWTHSGYKHRSLYAEDSYLADLLPLSATFTGHLAGAEALFEGSQRNLVGLRSFIGDPPAPQHALVTGTTGAGKSEFMHAFLMQTAARFDYTVIIEEGLSYERFTRALGERPIVIHPDGDLTINYFDTSRTPLGQLQIATAVALVSRMIGEAGNEESQQIRQAIIGHYINQLYADAFEEWSKRHRERLPEMQRLAYGTHRWKERMGVGTTELEAFTELRDRLNRRDDEALTFLAGLGEEEITKFLKHPQTERRVMSIAHAFYAREDYPTHSSLVELMQFARLPEHKKEQVDHLATLLSAWRAHGAYGRLFDGPTNVSLTGRVAHFELGYVPEQASELKAAVGLLISGFSHHHIISLPRAQWKRTIFEEMLRFLDVPGGEKIVAETSAQRRKFNCWSAGIFQQYGKFRQSAIRPVVVGNAKQFWLLRQFDRSEVEDLGGTSVSRLPCARRSRTTPCPSNSRRAGNSRACAFSVPSATRRFAARSATSNPRRFPMQSKPKSRNVVIVLILVTALIDAGCSTLGGAASDMALAGAGGVAGYHLSGGKVGGAAAGAAVGYAASKIAQSEVQKSLSEAEQRGYDRALNQAVKQHYWIIQDQQKSRAPSDERPARLIPVVIPETKINGVIQNAHVEYLRVES